MMNFLMLFLSLSTFANQLDSLASKKLIAIGESGHAVAEFHHQRSAISRRFIEKFGFRNIFVEEDVLSGFYIADAISSCRGVHDPAAVRKAFGYFDPATYRHNEFYAFYEFLCQWNTKNPHDPVRLYGIDVWSNYWDIRKYLELKLAPLNRPEISKYLAVAKDQCFLWNLDNAADYPTHVDWIYYEKHKRIQPDRNAKCLGGLFNLKIQLQNSRSSITEYNRIMLMLDNAEAQQNVRDVYAGNFSMAQNLRDAFQARALMALNDKKGAIFLAHNLHVFQKMSNVTDPNWYRVTSSGEWLKINYREKMSVIGMGGYNIKSLRDGQYPLPTTPRSIDLTLHQKGLPLAMVNAKNYPGVWSVHNETSVGGLVVTPMDQFDYYFFIDQSAPATPWKY
jgi:erythromycin esterase-like protein